MINNPIFVIQAADSGQLWPSYFESIKDALEVKAELDKDTGEEHRIELLHFHKPKHQQPAAQEDWNIDWSFYDHDNHLTEQLSDLVGEPQDWDE